MTRLLIVIGPRGFETAWKARDDPEDYALLIVDGVRRLVDTVVAVPVPEWYDSLEAMIADETTTLR